MANEVTIIVKAKNETKAVFAEVEKDAKKLGANVGKIIGTEMKEGVQRTSTDSRPIATSTGNSIGNAIGDSISKSIRDKVRVAFERIKVDRDKVNVDVNESRSGGLKREKVKVDVDVDESSRRSFLQKMYDLGDKVGTGLKEKIGGALGTVFSGNIIGTALKTLAVALAATVGLPVIGAAFVSALMLALGGGALALGIAGAFKDPRIQGAAKELGNRLGTIFEKFGEPFRGPLANFLEKFTDFLKESQPLFDKISQTFAPVLDALGTGFIGALQNMLPGLTDAIIGAAPFFESLAKHLPEIGQRLGDFFREMSENGPEALQFFDDLLTAIEKVIGFLGRLIGALARMYSRIRPFLMAAVQLFKLIASGIGSLVGVISVSIRGVVGIISSVFNSARRIVNSVMKSIVGSVASSIAAIGGAFAQIRSWIAGIKSKTVTISVKQVYSTIGSAINNVARTAIGMGQAHGGITGAATGGIHAGLRLVGEQGPELAELPAGSRVTPAGQTRSMLEGMRGQGGETTVVLRPGQGADVSFVNAFMKALRAEIRDAGGNVQKVLGTVAGARA